MNICRVHLFEYSFFKSLLCLRLYNHFKIKSMKNFNITILFLLATLGFTYAQNFPINFESGVFNITNFDGGVLTVIDNPQSAGINTSAKVAQMVKNTGQIWGGSYITLDNAIDFSIGKKIKMKVFAPKIGAKVLFKVENASDGTISFEKETTTTLANQWEELTFDFSAVNAAQSYRKIVIIFDLGTVGDGSVNFSYLLDDIVLEGGNVSPEDAPKTAAPTPPAYGTSKVISIFSDAFTDVDGTNFNPFWGQATLGSIENMDGNKILKLKSLNYQGIELMKPVNAAAMVYLHIDVWTADETLLDIYPISRTTGEKKANLKPLKQNEWNSFDIKLSDITTQGFNLADLHQFKFIGAGGKTVYIDNLYLYDNNPNADTEAPQNFTATIGVVTYNSIQLILNATDNSGAVNYTINVGGNKTIIGAASGVQKTYEFTRLPSSTEYTFSIEVLDPAGNGAANNPIQRVARTLDAFQAPMTSSPTPPTRVKEDVISIFSDRYTTIANTNFNPWWQQSSWFTSEQVGGNEVVKYENFNYQGIEIGSVVNASKMEYLHLDVWTPNETSLSISPISSSTGEKAFVLKPINLNQWNSYDIPLSAFTIQGLSMSDILHLKFVGSGKSIIYLDNIYFYKGFVTSSVDMSANNSIRMYPNPAVNNMTIKSEINITNIEIYSLSGKLIQQVHGYNKSTSLDISSMVAGYYYVSIILENGERSIQKLIKL